MKRAVLIGDIHSYQLWVPPWQLLGKRVLGQINLWKNRRHRFKSNRLNPVVDKALTLNADLLLLSGDFSTTALPCEFDQALRLLKPLMDQVSTVLAVPGNHDRYTFSATRRQLARKYLQNAMPAQFPAMIRVSDQWSVLALDSAVPRCISSRGRLGKKQIDAAIRLLDATPDGHNVIVLCHYAIGNPPAFSHMKRNHLLEEQQELVDILGRSSQRLNIIFSHGHVHYPWAWPREEGFFDLNNGSPTMSDPHFPHGQGFWELTFNDINAHETCLTHHVLQGPFEDPHWTEKTFRPIK
ncbi:MAG: metallophosphoesterase [Phycisphaeraceae bacterium]|nr:metallophosphoesterase [Phycisphaeraceae bacterium]